MLSAKKCPMCGTKMSKVNGVLTCPICGYNESSHDSSYTTSDAGAITKNTNASTSINAGTNKLKTNNNTPGIRIILLVIFAGIFIPAIAWFFASEKKQAAHALCSQRRFR